MVLTRSQAGQENAMNTPVAGLQGSYPEEVRRTICFEPARNSPTRTSGQHEVLSSISHQQGRVDSVNDRLLGPSAEESERYSQIIPRVTGLRASAERRREPSPARSVASVRSTSSAAARIRQVHLEAEEKLLIIRNQLLDLEAERIKRRLAFDIESIKSEENKPLMNANQVSWIRNTATVCERSAPGEQRAAVERRPLYERRGELTRSRLGDERMDTGERRAALELRALPYELRGETCNRYDYGDLLPEGKRKSPEHRATYIEQPELGERRAVPERGTLPYEPRGDQTRSQPGRIDLSLGKQRVALEHGANSHDRREEQTRYRYEYEQPELGEQRAFLERGTLPYEPRGDQTRSQPGCNVLNWSERRAALENMGTLCEPREQTRTQCDLSRRRSRSPTPSGIASRTRGIEPVEQKRENNLCKSIYAIDDGSKKGQFSCIMCDGNHVLTQCSKFQAMTVNERWERVKKDELCFKCITSRHRHVNCKANLCGVDGCEHPHHAMLHSERVPLSNATEPADQADDVEMVTATSSNDANKREVTLKICPVTASEPRGHIFALLDEGSTVSLLEDEVTRQIGGKGPNKPLSINGVIMEKRNACCQHVKLNLQGTDENTHSIRARTMENLGFQSKSIPEQQPRLNHLKDLGQASVCYKQVSSKLLIGADNWDVIVSRELHLGKENQPAASRTNISWVFHDTLPRTALKQESEQGLTVSENEDRLENIAEKNFKVNLVFISKTKVSRYKEQTMDASYGTIESVSKGYGPVEEAVSRQLHICVASEWYREHGFGIKYTGMYKYVSDSDDGLLTERDYFLKNDMLGLIVKI